MFFYYNALTTVYKLQDKLYTQKLKCAKLILVPSLNAHFLLKVPILPFIDNYILNLTTLDCLRIGVLTKALVNI